MFKNFRKIDLSDSSVFWRYSIIVFALGLIIVFVGQTIFMFVVNQTSPSEVTSSLPNEATVNLRPQKADQVMAELEARPARLEKILATSTAITTASSTSFVDPSL